MHLLRNPIVLMGFKHVGKSVIGKSLAKKLESPFFDLDRQIEWLYQNKFDKEYTCRQIMQENGQDFFRCLEIDALCDVINSQPSVISLGGSTVLHPDSRKLIQSCVIVHITAPRDVVFERILMSGRPAFFVPGEDLLESFNRLWDEREKIVEDIYDDSIIKIINNSTVEETVNKIIHKISYE